METKKTQEMQALDLQGVMMNPPFDGAMKVLDEQNLTEPQRKHFEEKKMQIEAYAAEHDGDPINGVLKGLLNEARDLQAKCNRLQAKCNRLHAEAKAAAERHNHAAEFSKAWGVMVSCYRVIDKWFGEDIRKHCEKNDRTQKEGQMRALMEQMQKLTK